MSKTISYAGQIAMGTEEKINLRTIRGKVGYKITQFQIISNQPGDNYEYVAKIFSKSQVGSISALVNFTESDLLAVSYLKEGSGTNQGVNDIIIMDNRVTNQNIFVTIADASSNTIPCNYYIELETMALSDIETTKLTLQSIRTIASQ